LKPGSFLDQELSAALAFGERATIFNPRCGLAFARPNLAREAIKTVKQLGKQENSLQRIVGGVFRSFLKTVVDSWSGLDL
jgi:hypothetical protein